MPNRPTDPVLGSIAANVRRERERLGLTQEEFAEGAGFVPRFFQRIEAGEVDISISTLVRLAEALGVEAKSLLEPAAYASRRPGRPKKRTSRSES